MTHDEIIYQGRVRVLDHAAASGNVAETCRVWGEYVPRRESFDPSISGDGRWVVFESDVPFVYPDYHYDDISTDLYLADVETHDLTFLTYDTRGDNTGSGKVGGVDRDGGTVVFSSRAYWMTESDEDDDGAEDIYVRTTR